MREYFIKYGLFLLLACCTRISAAAQVANSGLMDTTGGEKLGRISIGGYIDTYYGYYFASAPDGNVPYMVSMARANELNINLAYIDLRYHGERIRARFVPGLGAYMNANYAAEPGLLKNIVEASAGVKLFKKKEIWLDAGILGSPYTNESAVSRDHLMYTRSFAPEYVPYYLAGAKLGIPLHSKVTAWLYFLNGWQQIRDQNRGKSFGSQLEYRPASRHLLNWNTYIGDERSAQNPDFRLRYFTDVYWIFNPEGRVSITSCAYIGMQERRMTELHISRPVWWQANFIARWNFHKTVSLSGRVEYFSDPHRVMINPLNAMPGFSAWSAGLCMNVKIRRNAMFRLEGRHFVSDRNVYAGAGAKPQASSTWVVSNLCVWF